MYCKNCGNPITGDSRFCSECGAEVDCNNEDENIQPAHVEYESDEPSKKPNKIVLGILYGIIILGLVCLAVAIIVNTTDSHLAGEQTSEISTKPETTEDVKVIRDTPLRQGKIYNLVNNLDLFSSFQLSEQLFSDRSKRLTLDLSNCKGDAYKLIDSCELFIGMFLLKNEIGNAGYDIIYIQFPDECEMMVTLEDNPQYAELNIIGTMLIAPNHDDYLKAYQSNEFFKDTDLLNRAGVSYDDINDIVE